jgi:hypothetical protein
MLSRKEEEEEELWAITKAHVNEVSVQPGLERVCPKTKIKSSWTTAFP